MYNTVKEMHIALDLALQHIDSNRKQSIPEEFKDMVLNYAVLQFVETRSSNKTNIKREGFGDSVKREDDLRDLKSTAPNLPVYTNENNKKFSILPYNYYKFVSGGGSVKFSKFELPKPTNYSHYICQVIKFEPIKKGSPSKKDDGFYNGFVIELDDKVIFNISDYGNMPSYYTEDAKFMIINLVLEQLNKRKDFKVYWENWNNIYKQDSFIFIQNVNAIEEGFRHFRITYDNQIILPSVEVHKLKSYPYLNTSPKPIVLSDSEESYLDSDNFYSKRNRHSAVQVYLEGQRLYVKEGDNFIVKDITLSYLKKPRLINHATNQTCEITVNREIIDLAAQRLKAYIKDEGYQHIVNESQTIE